MQEGNVAEGEMSAGGWKQDKKNQNWN